MSIRLDPRRLGTLKHLAGEAGVRPGDLVRQWVEERIDASRGGSVSSETVVAGPDLTARLDDLAARVAALEAGGRRARPSTAQPAAQAAAEDRPDDSAPAQPDAKPSRPRRTASARPSGERVGLHDEMIAVIGERGPMTAGELAEAITERGRYAPPRSGKPLDAATVSQRASNPTYRSRFTRAEGRIGLAEPPTG